MVRTLNPEGIRRGSAAPSWQSLCESEEEGFDSLECSEAGKRRGMNCWWREECEPPVGVVGLRFRVRLNGFPFHLSNSQFRVGNQKMPDHGLKGFGVGSNRR